MEGGVQIQVENPPPILFGEKGKVTERVFDPCLT